jgi:hypothetical protein
MLKKVVFILVVFFFYQPVCTQDVDFQKKYDEKVIELKSLRDSIDKQKASFEIKFVELKEQLNALENEKKNLTVSKDDLEKKIADLEGSSIKKQRDIFKEKCDSLKYIVSDLLITISEKDTLILKEKKNGIDKSKQERQNGQAEIKGKLMEAYCKPLDERIMFFTLNAVERDLNIIGTNSSVADSLLSLQKYYQSKQVLNEKFNEQKVTDAINKLNELKETKLVRDLKYKLSIYKECNLALKLTIDKIIEKDKKFIANDREDKDQKLTAVLFELTGYFRNYQFDFQDYPYLSKIILEILKSKQNDANSDITKFKEQL